MGWSTKKLRSRSVLRICLLLLSCIKAGAVHVAEPCCSDEAQTNAKFGPLLPESSPGIVGEIVVAGFGCSASNSDMRSVSESWNKIFLVQRGGGCSFSAKVLNAQQKGAKAVIVYDDRVEPLVQMASNGPEVSSIRIPSVFISKHAGERLIREKAHIASLSRRDSLPDISIFDPPILVVVWMFIMTFVFLVVLGVSITVRQVCCFGINGNRRRYYNVDEPSESQSAHDGDDFYYEDLSESDESDYDKEGGVESDRESVDDSAHNNDNGGDNDDDDDNGNASTVRLNLSGNNMMEPLLTSV